MNTLVLGLDELHEYGIMCQTQSEHGKLDWDKLRADYFKVIAAARVVIEKEWRLIKRGK